MENASKSKNKSKRIGYQRFFEGYIEVPVPKHNGDDYTLKRVYVDYYYQHKLSDGEWSLRRILFAGLFLVSFGLYIAAALVSGRVNTFRPVAVAGTAAILPFLFWAYYTVLYTTAKRNMTVFERKHSHKTVVVTSYLSAGMALMVAVLSAGGVLMAEGETAFCDWLAVLFYLDAAATAAFVGRTEQKTQYRCVENENARAVHYND